MTNFWERSHTFLALHTWFSEKRGCQMVMRKKGPKPCTPCPVKKSDRAICRTKEHRTRLQCLASAMPRSIVPSGAEKRKVSREQKRKDLAVLE